MPVPMTEKRNRQLPVPPNFSDYLTRDQQTALKILGNFGWQLKFIRRPLFREPTVVLSRSAYTFGILERDGRIHDIPAPKRRP